ncbi:Sec-independent protein translocase subunit TatB [Comamonas piscis]|uniref:Sec-independent protein translocase protein TatB n=1 Tax=Comamonas piscis TaxID=1562974 RepID=A0A7G5EMF3_9BURK|nr:Sec-independent protein translocase protein TatB [Comamonas piscis]QMV75178.1 Sec-independent protein translocase subunit TatB [Comamonas piscis]WSO33667.1 Sec-independent protein translocase protein TatB [Comamonas piscis]
MFDLGISKMALIGAVALIVIGPEKLPRVARTVGTLLGKAQRYVNDVKSEVNRSMELDELRKMKDNVESAARDVENTIRTNSSDFEKNLNDQANGAIASSGSDDSFYTADPYAESYDGSSVTAVAPVYHHPRKNWRVKKGATPQWYKHHAGVRTHVQSGAARVARFRPKKPSSGL